MEMLSIVTVETLFTRYMETISYIALNTQLQQWVKPDSWSSGNALVSEMEDLRLKSRTD